MEKPEKKSAEKVKPVKEKKLEKVPKVQEKKLRKKSGE